MIFIHDKNRKWWVLSAVTLSLGMVFIDQTIVNVSLPTIQSQFQASDTQLQWIINAYLLPLACFLIIGGRLGDLFGRKKFYILGMSIFLISSLFCGMSKNENWLIISRFFQGIGGSLLIPTLVPLCFNAISKNERGKFLGLQAGIAGIFLALGPFLGGLITETWDWRWIFLLNIPIGIIAIIIACYSIQEEKIEKREKLDLLGVGMLSLGLFSIVYLLMEGENWGWLSLKAIVFFILGSTCLLLLLYIQPRKKNALIDFSLFKDKHFFCGMIVLGCLNVALISSVFSTIYTQGNLGFSPLESGTLMLPAILPIFIITPLAGKLYDKRGAFIPVTIGMFLVAFGMLWISIFCFFNNYLYFLPGLIVYGIGIANVMSPISAAALSTIPAEKRGLASGILSAMRQIGGSIGLAIVGALLIFGQRFQFNRFLNKKPIFLNYFQSDDVSEILSSQKNFIKNYRLSPPQWLELKQGAMLAFNWGFSIAMSFTALICLVGMIVSWKMLKNSSNHFEN